jgi:hypothetical protein
LEAAHLREAEQANPNQYQDKNAKSHRKSRTDAHAPQEFVHLSCPLVKFKGSRNENSRGTHAVQRPLHSSGRK